MKVTDIFEGIPMKPSVFKNFKHQYTVGYEFEMAVTGYGEPYGDGADRLRDRFENERIWENEYFNDFLEDFFRKLFQGRLPGNLKNASDVVEEYGYQPIYGTSTIESYKEYRKKLFIDATGKKIYDALEKYTDLPPFPDTPEELSVWENLYEEMYGYGKDTASILQNQRELNNFISFVNRAHHTSGIIIPKADQKSFFVKMKNDGTALVNKIRDLNGLLNLYDVDREQVIDDTRDIWEDMEGDAREIAFDNWIEDQSSGGDQEKFGYVVERLEELGFDVGRGPNYFNVVNDETPQVDAEITTPVADHNTAISYMKAICNMISDDPDIFTNRSCGVHINIGTFNPSEIDWLKFMVIFDERLALKEFDRETNRYAISKLKTVLSDVGLINNTDVLYLKSIEETNKIVLNDPQKFSAVNFIKLSQSKPHIEIRAPGGEGYEDKADKLEWYTLRAIRALDIARDPNAYRKEYLQLLLRHTKYKNKEYPPSIMFKKLGIKGIVYNRSMPSDSISAIYSYLSNEGFADRLKKNMTREIINLIVNDFNDRYASDERVDLIKNIENWKKKDPDYEQKMGHPFMKFLIKGLNITV